MKNKTPRLIRVTTIPMSLKHLLPGQMKYMRENGFDVIMISSDGIELTDVIKNEGCLHIIVPMTRKITPVQDAIALWKLVRLFRKYRPDIVHSHTPKAGLLAMLAAKMSNVPVRIHTIAGLRFMTVKGMKRKILVNMEKLTARAATHVWPNSFSLLNYIRSNRLVHEKKLAVIGHGSSNGINLDRFSPESLNVSRINEIKTLLAYNERLTYLLTVGRIVKDKGIEELLNAFTRLYEKNGDLRLVLLGVLEEHLDPVSENSKQVLKEHPGVIHIAWNDAVEYFMHVCDLLVHPSHREGFPNVLLQAGAMNCPIVCSRIEGNVDIVDHNETGLLFERGNVDDLIQKLEYALGEPEKIKSLAANLQKKIAAHFNQQTVHAAIRAQYLSLLSNQTSATAMPAVKTKPVGGDTLRENTLSEK